VDGFLRVGLLEDGEEFFVGGDVEMIVVLMIG
jgi:hypothetical protein